jgi:hypothetical protein
MSSAVELGMGASPTRTFGPGPAMWEQPEVWALGRGGSAARDSAPPVRSADLLRARALALETEKP